MKLKHVFPLFFLLVSLPFYAQGEFMKEKKEQVKALKVAFLTNELALTPDEAEKFWPVYNAFDDKQFELRQQKMKTILRKLDEGSLNKMSDKEATVLLNQMENAEDELYQLRKKFITNLKTILSPVKIVKLKKAEEDFNRKLLKQMREKREKK